MCNRLSPCTKILSKTKRNPGAHNAGVSNNGGRPNPLQEVYPKNGSVWLSPILSISIFENLSRPNLKIFFLRLKDGRFIAQKSGFCYNIFTICDVLMVRWPSGKARVCKTLIRGFDSHPHLFFCLKNSQPRTLLQG